MSRFGDGDEWEGEPWQILAQGRWENNARRALKGKRGRRALADLRAALMALPEHRLIEGAMCTVGAPARRAAMVEQATADWQASPARYRPPAPILDEPRELDDVVSRNDGEGVCAIAAYAWYRAVQAGADPAAAFAALPLLMNHEGGDPAEETARIGEQHGLTFTLASELAYRNDMTFQRMTPEERWQAFVDWIDAELAEASA